MLVKGIGEAFIIVGGAGDGRVPAGEIEFELAEAFGIAGDEVNMKALGRIVSMRCSSSVTGLRIGLALERTMPGTDMGSAPSSLNLGIWRE